METRTGQIVTVNRWGGWMVARGAALAMAAMVAGCAVSPRPAVPQASNAVRQQMAEALQSGDRVALTRAAILLAEMGGGMSDRGFASFSAQLDDATLDAVPSGWRDGATSRADALHRWLHNNSAASSSDKPDLAAEVPAEARLVEGIASDPATKRLFAGTVVEGRLFYLERGQWREVPIGFPRSGLFGMAIDAKRRLLWIATGAADETAVRDHPMAGLIAVDLDRLAVVQRVAMVGEGVPGDVTVGPDGTVYLSDGKTGAVRYHRPGATGFADLVPAGRFKSSQGMAVSRDGKHLYVADYGTGLWIVRLRDGRVTPIGLDRPAMLDGIDGLVKLPLRNALMATQNGTSPRRVLRLELSRDGRRVERVFVAEIVPAEAGDPTLVTLKDRELWFVGDGQWERYLPGGAIKDGRPPRPTPIYKIDTGDLVITAH